MKKTLRSGIATVFAVTMLAASPSSAGEPVPSTFHGEGRSGWTQQHAFANDDRVNVTGSVNQGSRESFTSSQSRQPIFGRGTGSEDSFGHTYRLGDK